MSQTGVLEEDFTDDVEATTHRIEQLFSRLDKPWILTTGTVVEKKMMEMILSHPAEIPNTLAAYVTLDPDDPIWGQFFTESELQEMCATVAPIRLRPADLYEDEERFLEIMKKLAEQAGPRLALPTLQYIADNFMSNFKDAVHRQLLAYLVSGELFISCFILYT